MTMVAFGGAGYENDDLADSFVAPIDTVDTSMAGLLDMADLGFAALQQSRQAICVTDATIELPGPVITFVNEAYTEIFCCDTEDAVGATPRIGQGPLTNRKVLDRLRAHLIDGESIHAQAINYRLDGTAFRLRWSIDPLRRDGAVVGFVAHMQDVTAADRLRRRLAALDTFIDRGRAASSIPAAERDETVAHALAGAIRPLLAEIGTGTVKIGTVQEATQVDVDVMAECDPERTTFAVGTYGSIEIETHPDADPLVDRLAFGELAEHASWLLELGEPR